MTVKFVGMSCQAVPLLMNAWWSNKASLYTQSDESAGNLHKCISQSGYCCLCLVSELFESYTEPNRARELPLPIIYTYFVVTILNSSDLNQIARLCCVRTKRTVDCIKSDSVWDVCCSQVFAYYRLITHMKKTVLVAKLLMNITLCTVRLIL